MSLHSLFFIQKARKQLNFEVFLLAVYATGGAVKATAGARGHTEHVHALADPPHALWRQYQGFLTDKGVFCFCHVVESAFPALRTRCLSLLLAALHVSYAPLGDPLKPAADFVILVPNCHERTRPAVVSS